MTHVPEGWRLVPVEPTTEMVSAGREGRAAPFNPTRELWRAILDAAPAAPVQQAEPVAWGQLGMMNGKTYLRQKYDREPYPPPPDVVRNLNLVPLWTNPPAAEVQQQAVDLHRLKVAARAVTTAVYDRERLFAVTDLRAALDAMGE